MSKRLPPAVLFFLAFVSASNAADPAPVVVRVMSFNLWHGGDAGKQPLDRTVAVIQAAKADVVGLQETAGIAPQGGARPDNAAKIAERLGWHFLDQGGRTAIISRFKIAAATPRKWGAKLILPSGQHFYLFNAHLAPTPYQPYQLLRIPYLNAPFLKTEEEAIAAAKAARGAQVERMLAEVQAVATEGLPIFLTGDFNEPSHLDWTAAAAEAGHSPLKVEWPSSKSVVAAGFVDAYRTNHPDPLKHRGLTWTPTTQETDPKDHHDRIDFVYARGEGLKVRSAAVVGEAPAHADIVVDRYPSDHRAVVAEVEWTSPPAAKE